MMDSHEKMEMGIQAIITLGRLYLDEGCVSQMANLTPNAMMRRLEERGYEWSGTKWVPAERRPKRMGLG
jgi:hypothetical protein